MHDAKKNKLLLLFIITFLVLANTLLNKSKIGIMILILLSIEIALTVKHDD